MTSQKMTFTVKAEVRLDHGNIHGVPRQIVADLIARQIRLSVNRNREDFGLIGVEVE